MTPHHTSFSMTASRCPWSCVKMLFSSVVLPDPKNPVITWGRHGVHACSKCNISDDCASSCRMILFTALYIAHARHLAAPPHRDGNAVVNDLCINDLAIKIVQICQLCCSLRSGNLLCQPVAPARCCGAALHLTCELACSERCPRLRTMATRWSNSASELTAGQAGIEDEALPHCGAVRRRCHGNGRHLYLQRVTSGHTCGLLCLHLHCFLAASVAVCLSAHNGPP